MIIKALIALIFSVYFTSPALALYEGKNPSATTNFSQNTVYLVNRKDTPICGGVFLSPQIVISAAHCAADKDFSWRVKVKSGGIYRVERFEIHPEYFTSDIKIDLVIFFLSNPVSDTAQIFLSNKQVFVSRLVNTLEMIGIRHYLDKKPKHMFKHQVTSATVIFNHRNLDKLSLPDSTMLCKGDSGFPVFGYLTGKDGVLRRIVTHVNVGFFTPELHKNGSLGQCAKHAVAVALHKNLDFILTTMEKFEKGSTRDIMIDSTRQ
jgi:Trypsin